MAGLVLDSDVPGCWDDLFFDDCWVARKLMPFCASGYKPRASDLFFIFTDVYSLRAWPRTSDFYE